MDAILLLPLTSCVLATGIAARTWASEPDNRRMWPMAGVSALTALWALCDVMMMHASEPASAAFWARFSALSSVPMGPTVLLALTISCDADTPEIRRRALLFGLAGVPLVTLALFSDSLVRGVVPTWYGWSPQVGWLVVAHFAVTSSAVFHGFRVFQERIPDDSIEMGPVIRISVLTPLVMVSLTDVLLPALGIHLFPKLGVASLAFVGVFQTVSALTKGEGVLAPEAVTASALRALPDGVVSLTNEGLIRSANDRFADLAGLPPSALAGLRIRDFLPGAVLAEGEVRDLECELIQLEGAPISVSVSSSARGKGAVHARVLVVRDLREMKSLRDRLLLSGRMAAVGELAAGIAHELNNPITYVRANLGVLRENHEQIEKVLCETEQWKEIEELAAECESIVDESLEGIHRAASIVRDVREFSHAGQAAFEPTNLRGVIEQSVRVARLQVRKEVDVELDLPEPMTLRANGQRLTQVLVNLLVNAGHATDENGHIGIRARMRGNEVVLQVSDDGHGIPPADLERIFDPFFTTKPVGVGTGLGLAIAFGIAQEHGGTIEVRSRVDEGTTFTVRLPIGDDAAI